MIWRTFSSPNSNAPVSTLADPLGIVPAATAWSSRARSSSWLWAISPPCPPSPPGETPSTLSTALADVFSSQMAGKNRYVNAISGGASGIRMRSAARIDRFLGACSPTTMCRPTLSAKLRAKSNTRCASRPRCRWAASGSTSDPTAGSVTAPSASVARLAPSWQLDRYRSSRPLTRRAARAMRLTLASGLSRPGRAVTAANSAATKNPFSPTSPSVATIFSAMSTTDPLYPAGGRGDKWRAER